MKKEVVEAENAQRAVGPYSQAIAANGFMFISGQLPIDPATGSFVSDDVCEQTHQCFLNIGEVLKAKGSDVNNVVKVSVFLKGLRDFDKMNGVYATFFPLAFPGPGVVWKWLGYRGMRKSRSKLLLCVENKKPFDLC